MSKQEHKDCCARGANAGRETDKVSSAPEMFPDVPKGSGVVLGFRRSHNQRHQYRIRKKHKPLQVCSAY